MSHTARLMAKRVAILIAVALVLSSFVGFLGTGVAGAEGEPVQRLAGDDIYGTAAKVATTKYPDGAKAVVLTRGDVVVDGMAGSVLAGALDAPILLTESESLPQVTKDALADLAPETVYILGGPEAVKGAVEDDLEQMGYAVERIFGEERRDRFDTAVEIVNKAMELTGEKPTKAYVVYSERPVDALVAGSKAFVDRGRSVILPVNGKDPGSVNYMIEAMKSWDSLEEVVVVGGPAVVPDEVVETLADEFGADAVKRIGNADSTRVSTSVDFARSEFDAVTGFVVVYSEGDGADAGVDAVAAAVLGVPILYVTGESPTELAPEVKGFLAENPGVTGYVLGAVPDEVKKDVEEAVSVELVVTSVAAVAQTIKKGEPTELTFLVNGKETTVSEFEEIYGPEGYTVDFKYNKNVEVKNGVVQADANFKYAVEVTDPEGNVIPEGGVTAEHFADVTVIDAAEVAAVTEVGLFAGEEKWSLDYVTRTDTGITIKATKALNMLGEEMDVDLKPSNVTSSDVTVAYYDMLEGIVARKPGEVEFQVEFDGVEDAVILPLTVKAGQVASAIEEDGRTFKIEANTQQTITLTVLDQYGEPLRTNAQLTVKEAEDQIKNDGNNGNTMTWKLDKENLTLTLQVEAGDYTLVVEREGKAIGTVKVQAVNVQEGAIDTFKITGDDILKIGVESNGNITNKIELTIHGYIDGVKVEDKRVIDALTDTEDVTFAARSTNKDVATAELVLGKEGKDQAVITVTAVAPGTTTIELVKQEVDYITKLATFEVTVVSTVPVIDDLQIADEKDAVELIEGEVTPESVAEKLTAGKDRNGEEIFRAYMIDKLELVQIKVGQEQVEGTLIVTIKEVFGGKEFTFDAVITPKEATLEASQYGINNNKVYAGYLMKDGNKTIKLTADNVHKVFDGDTTQLKVGADNDPHLWFNMEKDAGEYTYTVFEYVKDNSDYVKGYTVYQAVLNWEPKTGEWVATGRTGKAPHDGETYVEYELKLDGIKVDLDDNNVKYIAQKKLDGTWVKLEPNTDKTLWFRQESEEGEYEFIIVTNDGTVISATLDYDPETTDSDGDGQETDSGEDDGSSDDSSSSDPAQSK